MPGRLRQYWDGAEWQRQLTGADAPMQYRRLYGLRVFDAGWPCRSLRCSQWWDANHQLRRKSGFRFARREVPLRPRWGAFVINTIVFALVCRALAPLLWTALRNRRRVRRAAPPHGPRLPRLVPRTT